MSHNELGAEECARSSSHQGVTLSNPALLCHCEREKPAVSRNGPDSSYVMTFTGKAELGLPAPESRERYTAFPSPQEISEIHPNCSTCSSQGQQGVSSDVRCWGNAADSLCLSFTRKWYISANMPTSLLNQTSLSTSHGQTLQQNNRAGRFLCIDITDGKKSY